MHKEREEKGVAMLPRGFAPQQTKRCDETLCCTYANSSQRYFLEQDLNAGAESSTAQHCTSEELESSLFLFSQLNAIFEMFYPLCCLISAINYTGHVMNQCYSRRLGLGSSHFLNKTLLPLMVLQFRHTHPSLRSRKQG